MGLRVIVEGSALFAFQAEALPRCERDEESSHTRVYEQTRFLFEPPKTRHQRRRQYST